MSLFSPTSIAVIGASATEGKVGHDILKNLLEQGYKGKVFPVNPKREEILGIKAFGSVGDISEQVDMAAIVIPAKFVAGVMKECAEKGVKYIVIISAGFKEVGTEEGKALEEEIKQIALTQNLTVLGPNCLGILRPPEGMNASFAKDLPPAGKVALVSQSGAFAVALMDSAPNLHLGFSAVVSIGNKMVMDESDVIELLANDPETNVIGLYLESITDGKRFREIAEKVAKEKHVVLIKAGVSDYGKKAASSHTGSLAGNDGVVDAVCAQAGIHRAKSLEEFTDLLRVLSTEPPLLSPNIAIITNAGGPGILAADAAALYELSLPELSEKQQALLKKALPATASIGNPIDVIGDAGVDRYEAALNACNEDPGIDGIAVLLTPQVMTPATEIAKAVIEAHKKTPLMPTVAAFMGGESVEEAVSLLSEAGIPVFNTPNAAMRALRSLRTHELHQPKKQEQSVTHAKEAKALLKGKNGLLDEDTTVKLLHLYGITLPKQQLAQSAQDAAKAAEEIGFPVVLKVSSPDIIHKTDVGGIAVGLTSTKEVEEAFASIASSVKEKMPQAKWNGVLVQQMQTGGNELILGGLRDPAFGPIVMVGFGGIYTELFKDVTFRLAPLSEEDAYDALQELTSWKLLLGMRGQEQSDIPELASLMVALGNLMADCEEITELDCNPVIVDTESAIVVDAKIVIGN